MVPKRPVGCRVQRVFDSPHGRIARKVSLSCTPLNRQGEPLASNQSQGLECPTRPLAGGGSSKIHWLFIVLLLVASSGNIRAGS
jgi:hypothetical protein